MKSIAVLAALAALTLAAAPLRAETIKLKADMKGASEVPPNSSAASGTAEATLDSTTRMLTYTITYKDLTGPATAAHFHGPSEPGKNAGVVMPFKSAQNPIEGSATLTEPQMADLLAGKWYANVHTAANPGGEIRGQMSK